MAAHRKMVPIAFGVRGDDTYAVYVCPDVGPVLPEPDAPRGVCPLHHQCKRLAKMQELFGVDLLGHGARVINLVDACVQAGNEYTRGLAELVKKHLDDVELSVVAPQAKAFKKFLLEHNGVIKMTRNGARASHLPHLPPPPLLESPQRTPRKEALEHSLTHSPRTTAKRCQSV